MSEHKPAVGYVRCSTEQQEDSPDQQKRAIQDFAAANGYVVKEWFVDFGKSGTTFDQRPEFQRLRAAVENHPTFNAVICYDESRWGRAIDAEENTFWRVYFRRRGVDVILVKTSIDPSHEFAPMLKAFEGVQASQYSKKLSELTFRGQASNGIYSSGGTAPYGYHRVAVNLKTGKERDLGDGEWCIRKQEKVCWRLGDPQEGEIVRRIFTERAEGSSYSLIVAHLNRDGIPCPKRGRWRNRDGGWSVITVKSIIENPVYCGLRVYNRFSSSKLRARLLERDPKSHVDFPIWRNDQDEWVVTENAHPHIVTREEWQKVNTITGSRSLKARRKTHYRSKYLLAGLLRCGQCGYHFQGWTGRSNGRWYPRYIDGGWKNKRECEYLALDKDAIEAFAINAVMNTLNNPDFSRRVAKFLRMLLDTEPEQQQEELRRLQKDLKDLGRRKQNLITAIERARGEQSVASLTDRVTELTQDEEGLKERIVTTKSDIGRENLQVTLIPAIKDFGAGFTANFTQVEPVEQKALLGKWISSIVVDRSEGVVRFYIRKVPAVTPALANIMLKIEGNDEFTAYVSARNRT